MTIVDTVLPPSTQAWPESVLARPLDFPVRQIPVYQDVMCDLDFAMQAGDETFAPALKLVLMEAVHLAYNCDNLSPRNFQAGMASVKAAYNLLLQMEVSHPVAKRLQQRYAKTYHGHFWEHLEREADLARQAVKAEIVASDGNVDRQSYLMLKRGMDIVLSASLIVMLAPLLLFIAVLVKWDSPGSVFFVQDRVGSRRKCRNGLTVWEIRNFRFLKFRSMYQNVDQSLHQTYIQNWIKGQVEASGDQKAQFKLTQDPRITRIGSILRKTSLDELPQLFNVLMGDMSLVGPRPVPTYEFAQYERSQRERLAAPPGLTGLWQVKGRGQTTFEEQITMDIEYIHNTSLLFDIKLLFMTVPAVLSSRGAR
jgi:lipopolysaccharide/colanic/teichoic acid biosynthesis glycosyltransferase